MGTRQPLFTNDFKSIILAIFQINSKHLVHDMIEVFSKGGSGMLIDQHLHTNYSWDCRERLENYLILTKNDLVTTEHLDYYDFKVNGHYEPDYARYIAEIDQLSKKYQRNVYRGIEVGYTPKDALRIREYLADKSYDLILLAIHQDGEVNYMSRAARARNPLQILDEYLELVSIALDDVDYAQVLAHIDFGMRMIDLPLQLLTIREHNIVEVMKKLVEKNMAFEVNTRSLYQYDNEKMYEIFLSIYKSVGGELISLGSDTHSTGMYMFEFDRAIRFLKKMGFHQVTQGINQKLHLVDI